MIKSYIKYLFTKPLKLAWLIAIYIFVIFFGLYAIGGDLEVENEVLIKSLLGVFDLAIFVLANLQPYKEWKDGLDKPIK